MVFTQRSGFTLIELSIVLVIIGLIVGGILIGRDLIEVAAIRKEVSLLTQYETAFNTFKIKYNGIPGDFSQSGTLPGVPDSDLGDGDGTIVSAAGGAPVNEQVKVWEHLSAAGLIAGSYNGILAVVSAPSGWYKCIANVECPPTTLNNNTIHMMWGAQDAVNQGWFIARPPDSSTMYSSSLATTNGSTTIVITNVNDVENFRYKNIQDVPHLLTVNEVYNIDVKMDDGVPSGGRVLGTSIEENYGHAGPPGVGSGCTDDDIMFDYNSNVPTVVHYVMSDTDSDCTLMYIFR